VDMLFKVKHTPFRHRFQTNKPAYELHSQLDIEVLKKNETLCKSIFLRTRDFLNWFFRPNDSFIPTLSSSFQSTAFSVCRPFDWFLRLTCRDFETQMDLFNSHNLIDWLGHFVHICCGRMLTLPSGQYRHSNLQWIHFDCRVFNLTA
jgi:hypothetical protein